MIPQIDIRQDSGYWAERLRLLKRERVQAAVRTVNKVLVTVRAEAARELKKEYPGMTIGRLKARLKMKRATSKDLHGALIFSGTRFSLYGNFGMRGHKGKFGVSFRGLPWRLETIEGYPVTPEMLERAFRQRARGSGRPSVFARHTSRRESFDILLAPGVARAFSERKIGANLSRLARDRYAVVFPQEARFIVSKR